MVGSQCVVKAAIWSFELLLLPDNINWQQEKWIAYWLELHGPT